jgi:hypothetical protein
VLSIKDGEEFVIVETRPKTIQLDRRSGIDTERAVQFPVDLQDLNDLLKLLRGIGCVFATRTIETDDGPILEISTFQREDGFMLMGKEASSMPSSMRSAARPSALTRFNARPSDLPPSAEYSCA